MDISPLLIFGEEVIKKITGDAYNLIKSNKVFDTKSSDHKRLTKDFEKLYSEHLTTIINWSNNIPFINLHKPKETNTSTIELIIASSIHKKNDAQNKIDENYLLDEPGNFVLVGYPGAGKTTTIKRLILKYISEINKNHSYGFPILIRLRNLEVGENILSQILKIFQFEIENRVIEYSTKHTITKKKTGEKRTHFKLNTKVEQYVNEIPILNFVANFLNKGKYFLLLDGLDEMDKTIQQETINLIQELGLKLDNSKIILTVRKSEIKIMFEGFETFEIAPLNQKQIEEISSKWLPNSSNFITELSSRPYKDLANRPIFLTLLLILYDTNKSLPSRPSDIYNESTYLIVKDWDDHRKITRVSKYSEFNTRKKIDFISELAYNLTYITKQKTFSNTDLKNIYIQIHENYDLPEDEVKNVAAEIESHTGLIIESNFKTFEFSHLSIQEYLCANHILKIPFSQKFTTYFLEYPEPLAIAICISNNPSLWMANLILNSQLSFAKFNNRIEQFTDSFYIFLNRLLIEKPIFQTSEELGHVYLYLFHHLYSNDQFKPILEDWLSYNNIDKSISKALKKYSYQENYQNIIFLKREFPITTDISIELLSYVDMPKKIIEILSNKKIIKLENGKIL